MYLYSSLIALLILLIVHPEIKVTHFDAISITKLSLLLLVMAALSITTQAFRGKAYLKVKKAQSLMPFMYFAIIFAGIMDWLFFSIKPDMLSCGGAVLVIFGSLLLLHKPTEKNHEHITLSHRLHQ